jgi:hypothetical protein
MPSLDARLLPVRGLVLTRFLVHRHCRLMVVRHRVMRNWRCVVKHALLMVYLSSSQEGERDEGIEV